MATFGSNTDVFARVLNTTTSEYVRKEVVNIMSKYKFLAMLKAKGRVHRTPGGDSKTWMVRYKRAPMQYLTDMPSISFQRINKRVNAQLPPRGYWASDAMTLWEVFINRGPQAFINLHESIMKELMEDIEFNFHKEFYKDGNAAANNKGIHGLESFGSISGAAANTRVGTCNDTYAGLSTAQGTKGTWDTTTWPEGDGKAGYHYWTPLILLYDSTTFGGTSAQWQDQCLRVFKYGTGHQSLRGATIDMWLLNFTAYNHASNKIEAREQIHTLRSNSNSLLVKLGFGDTLNYEGVDITYERGVPATDVNGATLAGYGLSFKDMELCYWTPELFWTPEVDFSVESLSRRYLVLSMCNLVTNPQRQCKIRYTSGADSNM